MGVDVVVMVENSRNIFLADFLDSMKKDEWGKRYCHSLSIDPEDTPWAEFEWEGKRYFSLIYGSPRYFRIFTKEYDLESESYCDNPKFDYMTQLSFLKAMLTAEKLAGGPVYLGNDVIYSTLPSEHPEDDKFFYIPSEMDIMIENWREIANRDIMVDELFNRLDD